MVPLLSFASELEKIAATAAARRYVALLRKAIPGLKIPKNVHPLDRGLSGIASPSVRARLSALQGAAYGKATSKADLGKRRLLALKIDPTARRLTPMQAADRQNDVRRSFTGAHAAKPGETLIHAAGTAEDVAKSRVKSRHLFRGNPIESKDVALMSRHPDVGAGYALGRATNGQKISPTGRLFAFNKKELRSVSEQVSDALPSPTDALRAGASKSAKSKWYARPKGSKIQPAAWAHLEHSGALNPTYEHIIPTRKRPKPVGEYGVRRSRTSGGGPAFAIRDVSGQPARRVFAEHAVR